MSRAQCVSPMPHPKILGMIMPCRKCKSCLKFTRLEWSNRMKMESFNSYRPYFTTWTFRPEDYTNSEKACKEDIQRFWKRLRKAGHDIRYFTVIERGSQKHRLHGHSILWSKSLASMSMRRAHKILESVWTHGIVDMQPLRGPAGLNYVTKYLVKDLSEEKQRNYQWSQKPMLGKAGLQQWESVIHHYHIQIPYSINNLPPNYIDLPILGEISRCYIPKSNYIAFCKALGISFEQEQYSTPETWDPLEINDGTSIPAIIRTADKLRTAKAIFQ